MEGKVILGKSGIEVTPICFGTWQANSAIWGEVPDGDILDSIRTARDKGVNYFDTAPTYGEGRAEKLLGQAMSGLPREDFVVCTKAYCVIREDGKRVFDLTGDSLLRQCEDSLKRLGLDHIDIYLLHAHDAKAHPEDQIRALEELKRMGKIRSYGISNHTVEQARLLLQYGDIEHVQQGYSLLNWQIENDILPFALAHNLGVSVFSPLSKGLLSGKYTGKETFTDSRKNSPLFQGEKFRHVCEQVHSLQPIAEKYNLSLSQLILRATLMHPAVHCAITGIKHPDQISESACVTNEPLDMEDYDDIRNALY